MNSPAARPVTWATRCGEQGVAGDVERNAQEQVGRPLVELARELSLGDVELEERVAGRKSHVGDLGRVPGRDDQAPAHRRGGIGLDRLDPRDQVRDLVDRLAIGCLPRTPLLAVDRTELPLRVGPLVPDRDPVFLEIGDIRRAPEEPDQLVNDGAERQASWS